MNIACSQSRGRGDTDRPLAAPADRLAARGIRDAGNVDESGKHAARALEDWIFTHLKGLARAG